LVGGFIGYDVGIQDPERQIVMNSRTYRTLVVWLILAATLWAQAPGVPDDTALQVQKFEDSLKTTPDDKATRAALLNRYFGRVGSLDAAKVLEARRTHILWFVNNAPDDPVAGSPAATIDRSGHPLADPEGYRLVSEAWRAQVSRPNTSVRVLRNAAYFFKLPDKELAAGLLERALTIDPSNQEVASLLGSVYALAILGVTRANQNEFPLAADPDQARSPFAKKALQALQTSGNVDVLAAAGHRLSFQGGILRSIRQLEFDADPIAEAVLLRAVTLDPANSRTLNTLAQHYEIRAATTRDATAKAALWKKASQQFEAAAKGSQSSDQRFSILTNLARAQMEAGDMEHAQATAVEVLAMAPPLKAHWNYGNALHRGNLVLGTIALKAGDTVKAKEYLLAAGRTPGSPQLNSFGPNMALARELLEKGERGTVIEYLTLCRAFWKLDRGRLCQWVATIEGGGTPDFGANLTY